MAILLNLLALLLQLMCRLKQWDKKIGFNMANVSNTFACAFPSFLLVVAHAIENDDSLSENAILNVAR
jgi:hypothetical protein